MRVALMLYADPRMRGSVQKASKRSGVPIFVMWADA